MYTIVLNSCGDVPAEWAWVSVVESVFLLSPAAVLPAKLIGLVWISSSAAEVIPWTATDSLCVLVLHCQSQRGSVLSFCR